MKRFFIVLFILFLIPWGLLASMPQEKVIAAKRAAAGSCDTVQAPSETDTSSGVHDVGKYPDRTRVGAQFSYAGTNGKQICKVRLYVNFTGSSEHLYQAAIYSDNGGGSSAIPSTALGTSDQYDLSGIGGSETTFDFEFSTPTSALTTSTLYWVVLQSVSDDYDVSNYASWHTENTGTTERVTDYEVGVGWATTPISTEVTKKFILYSQ